MSAKVYILFAVSEGNCGSVIQVLQQYAGVVAERVENPPNVVVSVIKAANRQKLAQLATCAIASVEEMTECYELLPVSDDIAGFGKRSKVGISQLA